MASALLRLLPRGTEVTGEVLLDGENVLDMRPGRLRAVRWTELAIVFQGALHTLNPVQRVGDQIAEAIRLHASGNGASPSKRVSELLELVGLPPRRASAYPHQLSGGQRQRVLIALAVACEPRMLIADEPTTALDVMVQAQVLRLLADLQRDLGLAIIFITHDLSTLANICRRIAVMYAGRIVEEGPNDRVFADAAHPYTRALAAAFPVIGDPRFRMNPSGPAGRPARPAQRAERLPVPPALPRGDRRSARAPRSSCGRRATAATRRACTCPARRWPRDGSRSALVEVRDLHVQYPGGRDGPARAVDGVNLDVHEGETLALVGESGCGKTTLARTIMGLHRPTSGEIRFRGEPLSYDRDGMREHRRNAQMIFQDPTGALNARQTLYEAVAEGLRIQRRRRATRRSSWPRRCRAPGCARRRASSRAIRTRSPAASASA